MNMMRSRRRWQTRPCAGRAGRRNDEHYAVSSMLIVLIFLFFTAVEPCCATSSSGIQPSLPEVLPAVQRLPEEETVEDRERIVHEKLPDSFREENIDDGNIIANIDNDDEEWRKALPPQLQQRRGTLSRILVPLRRRGEGSEHVVSDDDLCEIYLLGTSHVSKDSCVDAKLLMEHVQPDVLFMEICHQRLGLLADKPEPEDEPSSNDSKEDGQQSSTRTRKQKSRGARGMSWSAGMLTKIQQDYATKLGVEIGGEFVSSYKSACAQQRSFEDELNRRRYGLVTRSVSATMRPITCVLGDRPVRLTILRAWESLRFIGKMKLVVGLLWSSLRKPSEKELKEWMEKIMNDPTNDLLTESIAELSKHFPSIGETIIHERDTYMSCKLSQTIQLLGNIPASSGRRRMIVAVVGAGHCPGMIRRLKKNSSLSAAELEDLLQQLVETKQWKIENPEIKALTTDVIEIKAGV